MITSENLRKPQIIALKMLINVKFLGYGKEKKNVLKLRISYDTEEELKKAINILNPVVKKVKKHSNNDKRIHKLAYVDTTISEK